MSFVCILCISELNPIKMQRRMYSGPFSFEGLITFPPQANHTLGIFISHLQRPKGGFCWWSLPINSWLLLAHSCMGLTFRVTDWDYRQSQWMSCCTDADHTKGAFTSAGSGAYQDLPSDVPLVELIGSYSDVAWSSPLDMLVLGLLGKHSGAGQCQTLTVTWSG